MERGDEEDVVQKVKMEDRGEAVEIEEDEVDAIAGGGMASGGRWSRRRKK